MKYIASRMFAVLLVLSTAVLTLFPGQNLAWGQIGGRAAATPLQIPCCAITAIDTMGRAATGQVNATGKVFRFSVPNPRLLQTLKVGQKIWANFSTNQVSLNGGAACCSIISAPPPPSATASSSPSAPASAAATRTAMTPANSVSTAPATTVQGNASAGAVAGSTGRVLSSPGSAPPACCIVTAAATGGLVSAKDMGSGQVFQFNAKNQILLQTITVGQKIFANFTTRQVSLDGKQACCQIVNFAGTNPTAISKVGASGGTSATPTSISAVAVAPIVAHEGFTLRQRSPLAFRPIELVDSRTGKPPVDPNTGQPLTLNTVITLPNGKRLTMERYLEQMNALERQLSSVGYSLRDNQAEKVAFAGPAIAPATLQQQAAAANAKHMNLNLPAPNQQVQIQSQKTLHQQNGNPATRQVLSVGAGPMLIPGTSDEKNWDVPLGDPSSLYVDLRGFLRLAGSNFGTTLSASAEADGAMLNQRLQFVQLNGDLNSPRSQDMTASLDFKVLGNSYSLLHNHSAVLVDYSDTQAVTIDKSLKSRFSVGPVPMSVIVGARGHAGVHYYVGLAPAAVTSTLTPFVHTEAYAAIAGIDVEVATAGVGRAITFLNDDLIIQGNISLQVDQAGKPYIWQDYYANNTEDTLSGRLYLFATVYECWVGDWQPQCGNKEYDYDLWNWQGYQKSDYLFKKTSQTYF